MYGGYGRRNRGPYLRSTLARAVYERMQVDQELRNLDRTSWYSCDLSLVSDVLREAFVQLDCDADTQAFIDNCYEKADWLFTQVMHSIARAILGWFMTQTSINSLLSRGSMLVFTATQFQQLLNISSTWTSDSLLDLGAGDGKVTEIMASYFRRVHVTEMSGQMQTRLSAKGYKVLDVESWTTVDEQFDVVSCLNLLDRCDKPLTMLREAASKIKPDTGRLIVALVLLYSPYVEVGRPDHRPTELLPVEGGKWEEQIASLDESVFRPLGLEVERWSRLPYLCEGDLHQSFYWLSDAVFVLKHIPGRSNYVTERFCSPLTDSDSCSVSVV